MELVLLQITAVLAKSPCVGDLFNRYEAIHFMRQHREGCISNFY
jgi:hypothetical protein